MPTPRTGLHARPATELRTVSTTGPDDTFVLAVDLGTGGPKVAVLSGAGRIVAHAFRPVGLDLTEDGGAEQSPRDWWQAVVASTREVLADSGVAPERVVGIGCTSQWSGTVPVDDEGDAIGPAIIWMDSRGARAVRDTVRGALNVQGYSASKLARWVRRTGGIPSLSGKDPVGHIHFLRSVRPDVYRAAAVFLEPVDYLNLRLTGLARASHDSITVHWVTDNRDVRAVAYDDQLVELAGLERSTLPELVPTGSVLGGLAPDTAAELGLLAGTPVVAGTGDLHSAAVGSGAVADFDGHLYIGTSSWISCHVPFKKTDALTNIASIPSGLPGRYLIADEHETGGACLTWLRDNLLFPGDPLGPDDAPGDIFATLNDLAASVPAGRARGAVHALAQRRAVARRRPHHPRRLPQPVTLLDAFRHGAGRVRRGGPQLGLAARCGREVHQEALRLAGLRRRRRQLGPVVADPRRRHRAHHPPGGRPRPGQRARCRAAHLACPGAPDRAGHPGHRRHQGDVRTRTRRHPRSTPDCSRNSSTSTTRPKAFTSG